MAVEALESVPCPSTERYNSRSPPPCSNRTKHHFGKAFSPRKMSSRLSPAIKALIAGPHSVGSPLPSPGKAIADKLFGSISSKASSVGLAKEAWIVLTTAALVTTNSPPALCDLYSFAAKDDTSVAGQARVAAVSMPRYQSFRINIDKLPFPFRSCGKRVSSA